MIKLIYKHGWADMAPWSMNKYCILKNILKVKENKKIESNFL